MRFHAGVSMPMSEFLLIIVVFVVLVAVGALVVRGKVQL